MVRCSQTHVVKLEAFSLPKVVTEAVASRKDAYGQATMLENEGLDKPRSVVASQNSGGRMDSSNV